MKKIIFCFGIIFCNLFFVNAQKYGVVDMKVILEKIPEYKLINNQLEILSASWEKEITEKEFKLKKLKEDFKQEEIFYTENIKYRSTRKHWQSRFRESNF